MAIDKYYTVMAKHTTFQEMILTFETTDAIKTIIVFCVIFVIFNNVAGEQPTFHLLAVSVLKTKCAETLNNQDKCSPLPKTSHRY